MKTGGKEEANRRKGGSKQEKRRKQTGERSQVLYGC
jgi:hypothetical protein